MILYCFSFTAYGGIFAFLFFSFQFGFLLMKDGLILIFFSFFYIFFWGGGIFPLLLGIGTSLSLIQMRRKSMAIGINDMIK